MSSVVEMDKQKTHYRKAFNSPYLSAADIVGPTALTIARVTLEQDKTKKTKDYFNTAYFVEREIRPGEVLKPMILNVHNSEVMRDMCGSKFIEEWSGPVTVYVDPNVRFGKETVEGLRLKQGAAVITADQVADIEKRLTELGGDRAKFLKHFKVADTAQIAANDYGRVIAALNKKAQTKQEQADE